MENHQTHEEQVVTNQLQMQPTVEANPTPNIAGDLQNVRRYLSGALTAAAILSATGSAHAEDHKSPPTHEKAPQVARVVRSHAEPEDIVIADHKNAEKPHESHLKHNTIKLGAIGSLDKHPAFGSEVTWSYMPNLDESKKLHFTVTPIDFFVAQHHLHYEGKGEGEGGVKTAPKYFLGAMAGLTYMFNKHLELEVEVGGGATAIPYYQNFEGGKFEGLKYQLAPVVKSDIQLDFIVNPHFRTYIAYSPEYVLTPIPHTMLENNEIEKKTHFSNIFSIGVGTEF
jgi:hypothetical protein